MNLFEDYHEALRELGGSVRELQQHLDQIRTVQNRAIADAHRDAAESKATEQRIESEIAELWDATRATLRAVGAEQLLPTRPHKRRHPPASGDELEGLSASATAAAEGLRLAVAEHRAEEKRREQERQEAAAAARRAEQDAVRRRQEEELAAAAAAARRRRLAIGGGIAAATLAAAGAWTAF